MLWPLAAAATAGSLLSSMGGGGGGGSQDAGGGQTDPQPPVTTITAMDAVSRELLNTLKAKLYQLIIKKETDWTIMSPQEAERLNTKINELKQLQAQLSKEINDNKGRKKLTERQIEDFQDIISKTESKLDELRNQPVTEREYIEAKEKLQKYIQDLQNKEQQKNNLNETLTTLQRRIADAESNIQTKQTEIADIQNRLNNREQSVQERNTLKEALKKAQENLQDQTQLHQQQIDAKAHAQRLANQLNPEIQRLAQRVQDLSSIDTAPFQAQEQSKIQEMEQAKQWLKEQRKNALEGERQHVINLSNNVRTNREQLENFKQSLPQLAQMYNEAINELPIIEDAHYEINGPHRSFANQTRAKDVRNKFIQLKNAFEPFKNIIDPGIDFDHLIAAANSGIPDDSGALGPESLQYPKLRVRGDYPNSMHPDGHPVNRYYPFSLGERGSIRQFQNRLNNLNFDDRINQLRQEEQKYQQQIEDYNKKLSSTEYLESGLNESEPISQRQQELAILRNNLQQAAQQVQERENARIRYEQLKESQSRYFNQIPGIEARIAEKQAQVQQINNTIRENQERLRRTDWLEQEGIDPQVIRNNITAAEQELARMAQEKEALNQQLNTARQNFSATEQEIAAIQRDQAINKPGFDKVIERHDLPPELERQKAEMENRVKDLKRQLQDIPLDGSPETIEKAKNLTNEINEIQASYSLTAPLNEYHDKAGHIINEYAQTFFPEHQKLAMRMDEIEKKPRLEEILKPFLGKLARDPLDDVEKYRNRLNEETIYEGLMQNQLRKYGYDKHLIDNQFSKIGAGNSAAHHFARRQHAAMTDYLVRKEKAKMKQENFQKSFQHVLADRNATTNVINNLAQSHTAQGNIDTQNLNMRRQGLLQKAADAQNLAAMYSQHGNTLYQYGQGAIDRNVRFRTDKERYPGQFALQAASVGASMPSGVNMQHVHPHEPGVSNMPPLPEVKNALFSNLADGLNNVLVQQGGRPAAAHGGFLQKLAKGGKVNPQPEPFTPLPYTNEMLQRASYLENARQDSNADLYANMLSAWTASPRTPTMNRIGQAILKTHQNKRDDYEKHLGRVGTSTEIYGTLQKQQQRQAEFLKSHNLDERKLAEQIRHNKASEGIMSAKASGAAKEFKLNRADIKIVQDIKSRQGMINTILPKIQRAKELLKKINPGGMLANMTENPYILSSIPFADVGSQEDIAEFNNLTKGIADTLGSEMAGKNFGQAMVKLMRDSKISLADPKPTIENFFDKLESDLNHKAKVDQFLTNALAQGFHSHEAMALSPELYRTYQEINPEIDKEITPEEGESEPEFSLRSVESNALPTISPASETANLKTENKKVENKKKKKVSTLEKMDSIMNKAWG